MTSNPLTNALHNLLQTAITNHHVYPGFNDWRRAPIYTVIHASQGFSLPLP